MGDHDADIRLLSDDEIADMAKAGNYEDDEQGTAVEKFLNELESTMVELQIDAYKAQVKAGKLSLDAFRVTTMAYSIFDKDKILSLLERICDGTGATDDHRRHFITEAAAMIDERDSKIMSRFGKADPDKLL
jgi:hypothetical protein